MGNDNSKSTIENQQLILQLQNQILQANASTNTNTHYQTNQQQYTNHQIQSPGGHSSNHRPQVSDVNTNPQHTRTLFDILNNKQMMIEVDKNPATKRKLLTKLLKEHSHIMTSNQVQRINDMLLTIPISDTQQHNTPQHNTPQHNTQQHNTQQQHTQQPNTYNDKQAQRKKHYQNTLSELEKNNIDSLKMFALNTNYTLDELKIAYKKMAMKFHPDKPTGNTEQFQLVTKCYMSLLEKYKNRENHKHFSDLKDSSKSFLSDQKSNTQHTQRDYNGNRGGEGGFVDKTKFDVKMFNNIYEQNKLWDSSDDGYGSWFTSNDTDEPPVELFGNKFNVNVFNSTFEDYKNKVTVENGAIQQYKDPQELVSCGSSFTDIDIYARKIEDFSKPLPIAGVGGSKTSKDLAYTDLKTAYTSRGAFIDPNKVEYKTYKSVDDLKRDRGNIKFEMTQEQQNEYERKKNKEYEDEENRQKLIRQRDTIISTTYDKTHTKMLGYKA